MNVLIACEFSAVVREAFWKLGIDAWSCDLLPTEGRYANHLEGDVRWAIEGNLHKFPNAVDRRTGNKPLFRKWDLMIAHPPCTYLCNSGVRWLYGGKGTVIDDDRWRMMQEACEFYAELWTADIPRIAIENPIQHGYAVAKLKQLCPDLPDPHYVQPNWFGEPETKATGFRLKNLPPLKETKRVPVLRARVHYAPPSPDRWKERSRTLQGIADAMATQWCWP